MNAELFPYRVALLKKSLFVYDRCCPIRQFSFSVVVFRSEESYSVSERRPAIMNQEKIGLFFERPTKRKWYDSGAASRKA